MGRSIIIALLAVAVTLCSWSLVGCSNTELAQGLNAVAPGNGASASAGRSAVRMVLKVTPDDG